MSISSKIFFALCINLVLWECIIRLCISSPCTQKADAELGYVNIPSVSYLYTSEGYSRGRFNSLGFNDDEPVKDKDVQRIYVLGDSYTENFQVDRKDSYVAILEKKLNQASATRIDVVKLARDGLTPAHYPLLLKRLEGDVAEFVILQFWAHSGGDLYDRNIITSYREDGRIKNISVRPKVEDRGKEKIRFLINNSALAYFSLRRFKPMIMRGSALLAAAVKRDAAEPSNNMVKQDKTLVDMQKRLTFILKSIQERAERVLVFYIPTPGIFFKSNVPAQSMTRQALRAAALDNKMPFVDLTNTFRNHYKSNNQYLNGFINTLPGMGHLNVFGHRLVAKALYQRILREGMK